MSKNKVEILFDHYSLNDMKICITSGELWIQELDKKGKGHKWLNTGNGIIFRKNQLHESIKKLLALLPEEEKAALILTEQWKDREVVG